MSVASDAVFSDSTTPGPSPFMAGAAAAAPPFAARAGELPSLASAVFVVLVAELATHGSVSSGGAMTVWCRV